MEDLANAFLFSSDRFYVLYVYTLVSGSPYRYLFYMSLLRFISLCYNILLCLAFRMFRYIISA
jgi:hypothetical protein